MATRPICRLAAIPPSLSFSTMNLPFPSLVGFRSMMLMQLVAIVLIASIAKPARAQPLPFKDGDRVLFLGDSITQDGRYAALVEAYFWAAHADRNIDFINVGLSSETVSGITEPVHPYPRPNIHHRLDRALKLGRPDWVLICYGMNDGIYHPSEPRISEAYRKGLNELLDRVAQAGAKAIVLTPPTFDYDAPAIQSRQKTVTADEPYGYKKPFAQYNESLAELAKIALDLKDHPAVERVINLHQPTTDYVVRAKAEKAGYAYGDGVHPPLDGHLVMARTVLNGLGCDDAAKVLSELSGLHDVTETDAAQGTDLQQRFNNLLFERFAKRSGAYRQATQVDPSKPIDRLALTKADQTAAAQQVKLSDMVMELTHGESLLKLYRAEATKKMGQGCRSLAATRSEVIVPR